MPPHPIPIQADQPELERIKALTDHLQGLTGIKGSDTHMVRVPLRICPLGAHIDHQMGQVTGMTIDRFLRLVFAPNADRTVHIVSENFSPPVLFSLDDVPQAIPNDWGNYIRGAVLGLRQQHNLKHGLTAMVGSDGPVGGLSSSAAVTIAYLLALEAVNHLELTPRENIELVRFTENQYLGLDNGILDQSVILFSQRNHLTFIDCQSVEIKSIPGPLEEGDFEILVVYSGLAEGLLGTDYNKRVAQCREAARRLLALSGQKSGPDTCLRDVDPFLFAEAGVRLPPNLQRRAGHFFGEMQRVKDGLAAWQQGDLFSLGTLMTASGESSIANYECGSPPLVTLYEILREAPGVYGTRFSGAGFRGCCLALIDPGFRETIAEAVHRRYPAAYPDQADAYRIHFCRSDGRAELCKA